MEKSLLHTLEDKISEEIEELWISVSKGTDIIEVFKDGLDRAIRDAAEKAAEEAISKACRAVRIAVFEQVQTIIRECGEWYQIVYEDGSLVITVKKSVEDV